MPDQFVPFEGSLPANAAGIVWFPGFRYESDADAGVDGNRQTQASELRFRCTSAGTTRDVPFHVDDYPEDCGRNFCSPRFLIVPDDALVPDDTCEIVPTFDTCDTGWFGDDVADHLRGSAHFTVTAAAGFPDNLGTVSADDPRNASISVGSDSACDAPVDACVMDVHATLATAEPWRDALIFYTWVNGERWQPRSHYWLPMPAGGSWQGRGIDRLFRAAPESFSDDPGLIEINANVLITAELPGTDARLQTAPITVTLACGSDAPDAGFICDSGNAEEIDSSVDGGDSGATADASIDASVPRAMTDQGCGCSVVRPTRTTTTTWLLLMMIGACAAWRIRSNRAVSRARATRG